MVSHGRLFRWERPLRHCKNPGARMVAFVVSVGFLGFRNETKEIEVRNHSNVIHLCLKMGLHVCPLEFHQDWAFFGRKRHRCVSRS